MTERELGNILLDYAQEHGTIELESALNQALILISQGMEKEKTVYKVLGMGKVTVEVIEDYDGS